MRIMAQRRKTYKCCFVPHCRNSTFSKPDKLFVTVPEKDPRRKEWFVAVGRDNTASAKSKFSCCIDHFNLETDMENYLKFRFVGGNMKMKKGVVPHIFKSRKSDHQFDTAGRSRKDVQQAQEESCIIKLEEVYYFTDLTNLIEMPKTEADPTEHTTKLRSSPNMLCIHQQDTKHDYELNTDCTRPLQVYKCSSSVCEFRATHIEIVNEHENSLCLLDNRKQKFYSTFLQNFNKSKIHCTVHKP